MKKKKPLSYFFGKWSGPKEELDQLEKDIEEMHKKAVMRGIDFDKLIRDDKRNRHRK